MNELMNRALSKWPQMVVTGVPVSKEQALEVIRRTDNFFAWGSGNNHKFIEEVKSILQIPDYSQGAEDYDAYLARKENWEKKWGYIDLSYIGNDWISSSFICGPHGWMHPDGSIGFADNVGKWPEISELVEDWQAVATAFPFLDLGVTIMYGEADSDENEAVVSFRIQNGTVEVVDPEKENVHEQHIPYQEKEREERFMKTLFSPFGENAIPMATIKSWAPIIK